MAEDIYFFTQSYSYKPAAVATSVGGNNVTGHLPEDAIDYNMNSYWENDAALPSLKIDLGEAYTVDSLWFLQYNIDTYTIFYSTDDISYFAVVDGTAGDGGGAKWLFTFTERTARYWRLDVTAKVGGGNAYVYDVLLMEQRLAIADPEELPSSVVVIPTDRTGGGYAMADGAKATYSGERLLSDIGISFQFTPKANRDNLFNLFAFDVDGLPNVRSPLVLFPDSVEYPEKIYRVLWGIIDFPLSYQIPYKGAGFGGQLDFQEY